MTSKKKIKIKKEDKDSFMYYPIISSPSFNEDIYLKREFRSNEIKHEIDLDKNINNDKKKIKEFELEPHQNFLKNYISPDTPYNGILVFHGTGVGKTCSAISIAEGFKKTLKNINKKVLIICNPGIDKNFKKEIYDFSKELSMKQYQNINLQCTGSDYSLGPESIYLTKKQRKKEVRKMINSYYEFIGYIKFANSIRKKTNNWDGSEENINEEIKKFISDNFDDRVIIIDEIQNMKTAQSEKLEKTIQTMLFSIIKYAKNIKLVLMSATPMFDRADEIIFYLNLLLENDKRPQIKKNELFLKNGTLKKGAEKILKENLTGYVSYIRAEKPYIFPFKIYPSNIEIPKIKYDFKGQLIDPSKKIKYLKIINLKMNDIQNNTYIHYYEAQTHKTNKDSNRNNIDSNENNNYYNQNSNGFEEVNINNYDNQKIHHFNLTKISNIVFPKKSNSKQNSNLSKIGSFGSEDMNYSSDNGKAGFWKKTSYSISKKKSIKYYFQKHAIFNINKSNEAPFIDETHLKNYSIKFYEILQNIKSSKGLALIYSNFIYQGVLPFCLMLEQNGFTRECAPGEEQLLDYSANKNGYGGKRKPICYLCGKHLKDDIHQNEKLKDFHLFKRAKYILYFGESKDIIKIKKENALEKFANKNNAFGEDIKIFIGTSAISEGLDFKNIRQVHIIDPWYNLSKHAQIIGRAVRKNSHTLLPFDEHNVEIYEYASLMNKSGKLGQTESIDLRNYRIAENKDIVIKKINRIMKESSVDCNLFKKANVILKNKKVKQITSNRKIIEVNIGDTPYSSMCDYEKNCDYTCNWTPKKNKHYEINNDTFKISFGVNEINKCKKIIMNLFRENSAYPGKLIEIEIKTKYPDMDNIFIYQALENIIEDKIIILDKWNIKGYIIYTGEFYIFQQLDNENEQLPLIYRTNPIPKRKEFVELDKFEYDYPKNLNEKTSNFDKKKIYQDMFKQLSNMYNTHLLLSNKNDKIYIESVVGTFLDKINFKDEPIFISIFLEHFYSKNTNSTTNQFNKYIIQYYQNNNTLINYFKDINNIKNKIKDDIFVGFCSFGEYYVLREINKNQNIKNISFKSFIFEKANEKIKNKIIIYRKIYNSKKNTKNKNVIYGEMEIKNEKKERNFKIIDKSEQGVIYTKQETLSRRTIVSGRTCKTFDKKDLLKIYEKLNIQFDKMNKFKKDFLCNQLEIYLRMNQIKHENNKTWFIFTK